MSDGSFTVEMKGDETKLRRLLSAMFTAYGEMAKEEDDFRLSLERDYLLQPGTLRRSVFGVEGTITVRGALRETRL